MRPVGFSGEINRGIHLLRSEENDIIKQYPGKPKGGRSPSLLFSLILQPVRINKPGAPLLGLAKSIYYCVDAFELRSTPQHNMILTVFLKIIHYLSDQNNPPLNRCVWYYNICSLLEM